MVYLHSKLNGTGPKFQVVPKHVHVALLSLSWKAWCLHMSSLLCYCWCPTILTLVHLNVIWRGLVRSNAQHPGISKRHHNRLRSNFMFSDLFIPVSFLEFCRSFHALNKFKTTYIVYIVSSMFFPCSKKIMELMPRSGRVTHRRPPWRAHTAGIGHGGPDWSSHVAAPRSAKGSPGSESSRCSMGFPSVFFHCHVCVFPYVCCFFHRVFQDHPCFVHGFPRYFTKSVWKFDLLDTKPLLSLVQGSGSDLNPTQKDPFQKDAPRQPLLGCNMLGRP